MSTPTILDDEGATITVGARTVGGGTITALLDCDERGWKVEESWPNGDREEWLTRGARGPWDYDTLICDETRIVKAVALPSSTAAMVDRIAHQQGQADAL